MMLNRRVRKLSALLLAVVLLLPTVTVCLPAKAAAAVTPPTEDTVVTGSVTQDFELAGGEGVPVLANSGVVGLSAEKAHSGSISLKVNPAANSQVGRPRFVVAADGRNVKLTHGVHYEISFWVYADSAGTSTNTLSYYAAVMGDTADITTSNKALHAIQYAGKQKIAMDTWVQLVMDIPAVSHTESTTDGSGPLTQAQEYYLSLGVCYDIKQAGTSLYIDDIAVTCVDTSAQQTYESFTTGVHASGNTDGVAGNGEGREISEAHNHTPGGTKSVRMTMNGYQTFKKTAQTVAMGPNGTRLLLTKGKTYTVSAWLYSEEAVTLKYRIASVASVTNVIWGTRQNELETVVELSAGQWKQVTVDVTLTGLSGQNTAYLTLGTSFADETVTATGYVYLDDVEIKENIPSVATNEQDFEDLSIGASVTVRGDSAVSDEQNRTEGGRRSAKVLMDNQAGVNRAQLALLNSLGQPMQVEVGKCYEISMWVYVADSAATVPLNYWLSSSTTARALSNKSGAEYDMGAAQHDLPTGSWQPLTILVESVNNGPYLILGITTRDATDNNRYIYIDDVTVTESTPPAGFTYGLQDYESYEVKVHASAGTGIHGNGSGREISNEQNRTPGGDRSIKLNVNNDEIGYYARTVLPMNGADFTVRRGDSYLISFWLYSDETREITWYVGSTVSATKLYTAKNDIEKQGTVTLPAGQWTQVTTKISGVMGHYSSDTAYLTIGAMFPGCADTPAFLYLDDVELAVPDDLATLTFHGNGGSFVADGTAFPGEVLGFLPTPTRTGHLFDGWYNADGTVLYTAESVLPADANALDLYAIWTSIPATAPSLTTGFEEAEYTVSPYLNDGTAADAARGNMTASAAWLKQAGFDAETGDGSMQLVNVPFVYESASAYQAFALMNGDGTRFVVKAGTKYRITYSYRGSVVSSAHSYVAAVLTPDTAFNGVGAEDQVLQKNDIHGEEAEWSRSEECVVAQKDGYVYLTLSARSSTSQGSSEGHVALIDNVTVEVLDDTYTVVTFVSGGDPFATRVGKAGAPITYPAVTVESGKELEGFYTDAELTDKFEPAVYPAEDITLYARFTDGAYDGAVSDKETVTLSFEEDGVSAWYAANNHRSYVYREIDYVAGDADNARTGDSYIRFNALEWHYRPAVLMLYDPDAPHSILYLEPNSTYKLRFYVNPQDDFLPISIGLSFCDPSGFSVSSESAGTALLSLDRVIPGEWALMEQTVTTGDKRVALTMQVTSAALGFRLDDISIQRLRPVTVRFETNGGENLEDMQASTGTTLRLPTDPYREGYEFRGWYTDKELTQPFDDDTILTGDMILYAKWRAWRVEQPEDDETPTVPEAPQSPGPATPSAPAQTPVEDTGMDTGDRPTVNVTPALPEPPPAAVEPTPQGVFSVQMLLIIIAGAVVLVGGAALMLLLVRGKKRKTTEKEG